MHLATEEMLNEKMDLATEEISKKAKDMTPAERRALIDDDDETLKAMVREASTQQISLDEMMEDMTLDELKALIDDETLNAMTAREAQPPQHEEEIERLRATLAKELLRKKQWPLEFASHFRAKYNMAVPKEISLSAGQEYFGFKRNPKTTAVEFHVSAVRDWLKTRKNWKKEQIDQALPEFNTDNFWTLYDSIMEGSSVNVRRLLNVGLDTKRQKVARTFRPPATLPTLPPATLPTLSPDVLTGGPTNKGGERLLPQNASARSEAATDDINKRKFIARQLFIKMNEFLKRRDNIDMRRDYHPVTKAHSSQVKRRSLPNIVTVWRENGGENARNQLGAWLNEIAPDEVEKILNYYFDRRPPHGS